MSMFTLDMALAALAALSLAARSTTGERLRRAAIGATAATDDGDPHRRDWRRDRYDRHS